jgi:hypothetical protein
VSRYAEATTVSSDKSRAEIERILVRYGAAKFAYGWGPDSAVIGFEAKSRQVRFFLPLPDRNAREFTHTPERLIRRTPQQQEAAFEQGVRQRWRALALVIKAKLEAVEAGIVTFEQEFGMHMVLPNGSTVGDMVLPQIEQAYETGVVPPMLAIEAAS